MALRPITATIPPPTTSSLTTTTTTTAIQTGTQLVVGSETNTTTIGNMVTDVTLQPYIASRIISFFAYNMRPGHIMHVFFDGINVDEYCAPGIIPSTISNTADYRSIEKNGNWGEPIFSDSQGRVAGQFNIPEAKFKTGDRLLQICDVDNIALGSDSFTTISSSIFTASNLNLTKQSITLTTVNPTLSFVPVSNTVTTTNTSVVINRVRDIINVTAWYDPIAQALTINTPNGEAGIFATAIDIFFRQKSQATENGITVYLCEINNGYPDGRAILPFSTVHLDYSDINISLDSTVPTKFVFESPVFMNNGKEYAVIIRPDANDPDYQVFTANLGDTDISTNIQVFSQPVVGTAFYGATMNQWTALQKEYVKFNLYRANFSNNSTGSAVFENDDLDFIPVYNLSYSNTSLGLLPGDIVYQSVNTDPTTITSSVNGLMHYYDLQKELLYVDESTGNFTSNSFIQIHRFSNNYNRNTVGPNTSTLIAAADTGVLYDPKVNAFVTQFATITPAGTGLSFKYSGTSNTYLKETTEQTLTSGYETEFYDYERIVASKSNMPLVKSATINAFMTTDSEFLSPVIDTVRNQQLVIGNDVDAVGFNYNEFFSSGESKSKYISKPITLAVGQDAQDLQVTLTAFRPVGSDIQVWVKYQNGDDTESLANKTWTPLLNKSYELYSEPSNPDDFKEFTFVTPTGYGLIPTTGTITSTNTSVIIVGNNTIFDTELEAGWYINMKANTTYGESTRKIVSIANSTQLTLDKPFNTDYTDTSYYLVPPPTTAWSSKDYTLLLNGTVSVSTSDNSIIGVGTSFDTELTNQSILSIDGDRQQVVSIANSTYLTVGQPWATTATNVPYYNAQSSGLTYFNNDLNIFTHFIRFQIKVILQSDDTSKVPIIDDLRALALML